MDLGTEDYLPALRLQHELSWLRRVGLMSDVVLVVEHPLCITVGRGGHDEHVLAEDDALASSWYPRPLRRQGVTSRIMARVSWSATRSSISVGTTGTCTRMCAGWRRP